MTTLDPTASESGVPAGASSSRRHAAMTEALGRVRRRRGGLPLATILVVVGALSLPTGIIVIIVGWYGAAHTLNVYEQNSYILSGGFLGLGLVIAGGFLYFGYWMTRQLEVAKATLRQMGRDFERVQDQLGAVAAALPSGLSQGGLVQGAAGPDAARPEAAGASVPAFSRLVATERGTLVHRPECQVVARRSTLRAISSSDAALRPCRICQPYGES